MTIRLQDTAITRATHAITTSRPTALRRARRMLRRLCQDQRGANFIEYGVLAALIALAGMSFVKTFGDNIKDAFGRLGKQVDTIAKQQ